MRSSFLIELFDHELLDVIQLQVEQINRTMLRHGFEVKLTDEAKKWIVEKTCADRSYGARPLRRALQKYVEDPLSEALIQGHLGEAVIDRSVSRWRRSQLPANWR